MAHTFTRLLSHIIFSTKDRLPQIDADLKLELYPYMGGILKELDAVSLAINGPADHVHILASMPATRATSDILRVLKASSSKWVHDKFPSRRGFNWQVGYGAFSVSQSNVPAVTNYIAIQEQHHRKTAFKEEFIEFLVKHELEYDERYIWE